MIFFLSGVLARTPASKLQQAKSEAKLEAEVDVRTLTPSLTPAARTTEM